MAATEPIRDKKQFKALAEYFLAKGELRNYTMVVMDAYTLLRISDLLRLKWSDVYDEERQEFRTRIYVTEKKTGKEREIPLHPHVLGALRQCYPHRKGLSHQPDTGLANHPCCSNSTRHYGKNILPQPPENVGLPCLERQQSISSYPHGDLQSQRL